MRNTFPEMLTDNINHQLLFSRKVTYFDLELRRGSLQLWQFLIALLEDPSNCAAITWTGRGMEFKLIEPEEVRFSHRNL